MQQIKSALPTIEHHILVLLIGAALGSYFTVQLMSHNEASTKAAVRDALKAVPVAQAEASVPKR
ncbi:UNVERIFIED_ORG: ABC-type arginine transport system permease subunit [Arthrobacter sp. UYEF1]